MGEAGGAPGAVPGDRGRVSFGIASSLRADGFATAVGRGWLPGPATLLAPCRRRRRWAGQGLRPRSPERRRFPAHRPSSLVYRPSSYLRPKGLPPFALPETEGPTAPQDYPTPSALAATGSQGHCAPPCDETGPDWHGSEPWGGDRAIFLDCHLGSEGSIARIRVFGDLVRWILVPRGRSRNAKAARRYGVRRCR